MKNVLTVTVNPAIDKSASIPALIADKKLKCSTPVFEPGGGGINVARTIKRLGEEAIALFFSGGHNGEILENLLLKEEVKAMPIHIKGETRENFTALDLSSNHQYRFGMPGPLVRDNEWKQMLEEIERFKNVKYVIASGSLTVGVPEDFFARIAGICKKKNIKLIVDAAGKALQLVAENGVYLLKPNLGELAFLAGKQELTERDVKEISKDMISKFQCEIIITSLGASGAMLVTETITKLISAPCIKVKSTVGAGDSLVGGIVAALLKGFDIIEATKYGVASGTAATMNPGTQLCSSKDVENLYAQIK